MYSILYCLLSLNCLRLLASSLSYRGGHHSALINCPTCEHHICDVNSLMQCEVCQIAIPHKDQPPQNVKCAQVYQTTLNNLSVHPDKYDNLKTTK